MRSRPDGSPLLSPRWVAAGAVGLPVLLGSLDVPPALQRWLPLFVGASAFLALGTLRAMAQPTRRRALGFFCFVQAPHFLWTVFLGLRHPTYLFAAPPAEAPALPGIVFLALAASDLVELGLVALAYKSECDASDGANDRFLAAAGAWLVGTGLLRWPPLLLALELEGHLAGGHVPPMPSRSALQMGIGVAVFALALHRLARRRRGGG